MNEYGRLTRVLMHPVEHAFAPHRIDQQWRALNFTAPPDVDRAREEYAVFRALVAASGAEILDLPPHEDLTLDAIYARDASAVTPQGVVLCRMGKATRTGEPHAQRAAYEAFGVAIAGAIEPPDKIEGGDIVWFDAQTVAIGRGYRTNDAGIEQFTHLAGAGVNVHVVQLPHYRGPGDVFHLMSIVSPVAENLAVVYSPLMPVSFREWMLDRGMTFVEVPENEFDAMGANVLAIAPRRCVMAAGAPVTRRRLEAAGAEVQTYTGIEISVKGGGGPTCLTRPLARA